MDMSVVGDVEYKQETVLNNLGDLNVTDVVALFSDGWKSQHIQRDLESINEYSVGIFWILMTMIMP